MKHTDRFTIFGNNNKNIIYIGATERVDNNGFLCDFALNKMEGIVIVIKEKKNNGKMV